MYWGGPREEGEREIRQTIWVLYTVMPQASNICRSMTTGIPGDLLILHIFVINVM